MLNATNHKRIEFKYSLLSTVTKKKNYTYLSYIQHKPIKHNDICLNLARII